MTNRSKKKPRGFSHANRNDNTIAEIPITMRCVSWGFAAAAAAALVVVAVIPPEPSFLKGESVVTAPVLTNVVRSTTSPLLAALMDFPSARVVAAPPGVRVKVLM
jgi:hypothetical protein